MITPFQPHLTKVFRFLHVHYADGVAELAYAFDDGVPWLERITFPGAPAVPVDCQTAFERALKLLHWVAGISYYKAALPPRIELTDGPLDDASADLLDAIYLHGLGELACRHGLDLRERVVFPRSSVLQQGRGKADCLPRASALRLPRRSLVPIGGGKDSLVAIEAIKSSACDAATVAWIGYSPLIEACAVRTGLAQLNIQRELAPALFEANRSGAWNGHIPVTAVNSVILVVAAILYGFDSIVFANECSASAATLEYGGHPVNHQWSKSYAFETMLACYLHTHIAVDLDYFSLLRPYSELAIARAFARLTPYFDVFSSCNRNFRILGTKPDDHWCGQCPKCHFVFLSLALFLPKSRLLTIFGRNLLDDETQCAGFDALLEYGTHKPFECVGEGGEARAAFYALWQRPEWREDALVTRFGREIVPRLEVTSLALAPWLQRADEHQVPPYLQDAFAMIDT